MLCREGRWLRGGGEGGIKPIVVPRLRRVGGTQPAPAHDALLSAAELDPNMSINLGLLFPPCVGGGGVRALL